MIGRGLLLACLLALSAAGSAHALRPEIVVERRALATMPRQIGRWTGTEVPPFDAQVVKVLGVDEYVNRIYESGLEAPVGLYVGYYRSQREGDTIHSPLNCLPGAGWQPMTTARIQLPGVTGPRGATVNRFLIQKGLDRQVVLYWYQSHGRIVASEYTSKALLIWDALRLNRSDAALIRIVSPLAGSEADDRAAEHRTIEFAQRLLPVLDSYLPS